MNKTTAALKLAEEALETAPIEYDFHGEPVDKEFAVLSNKALAVIREALAEQEKQEPVFWYRPINEEIYEGPVHNDSVCGKMWRDEKPGEWLPLYAAPVSAKMQGDCTLAAVLAEREACAVYPSWDTVDDAIAAEREACAQTVETESQDSTRYEFAAAIRARGKK